WSTPHGEYYLRGGHRLWASPEDAGYVCPEGNVKVLAERDKVSLQGEVDASGLEKEISFRLEQNRVLLTHRLTWRGSEPVELAPWSITQVRLGGTAILPLATSGGLLPNRNIVLWQYSRLDDERFELCDDLILLHGHSSEHAFKVGNYNSQGWIACLWQDILFVKRFSVADIRQYPDLGSNVEAYVRDSCLELENLEPLTHLQPGASTTLEETWEISAGKYSMTVEDARKISKQLLS
ncbi:MAG TPA: hypothetical protein VHP14_23790, partial [Anaerolineales bacterium]|nr:hypothetical protein [Anaerolineales bacterium]